MYFCCVCVYRHVISVRTRAERAKQPLEPAWPATNMAADRPSMSHGEPHSHHINLTKTKKQIVFQFLHSKPVWYIAYTVEYFNTKTFGRNCLYQDFHVFHCFRRLECKINFLSVFSTSLNTNRIFCLLCNSVHMYFVFHIPFMSFTRLFTTVPSLRGCYVKNKAQTQTMSSTVDIANTTTANW